MLLVQQRVPQAGPVNLTAERQRHSQQHPTQLIFNPPSVVVEYQGVYDVYF